MTTYTINLTDGSTLTTVTSASEDTTHSPITLIGQGSVSYGQALNNNLVHMLENFSNTSSPAHPLVGCLWYNSATQAMNVWNGSSWVSVNNGNVAFYATAFGVKADGVTSDDVAMANAVDAAAATGSMLYLPAGSILLTGATTINLRKCHMIGTGVQVGDPIGGGISGTTFLITSTTVKPFNIGCEWGISGCNFYWPNQLDGVTVYPPLLSPTTETTSTACWYMDHCVIVNAYDGIVAAGGAFEITDSYIYVCRDAFRISNIGDSFRLNGVEFTPGPWFSLTGFVASELLETITHTNTMFHFQAGGNNAINFSMDNIGAFAWRYGIKIDSGVEVGISRVNWILDGVVTALDASDGTASWAANAMMTGECGSYLVSYQHPALIGNHPMFNLGGHSDFNLNFWRGGSAGSFIESTTSNIKLVDVCVSCGSIADGGDYYGIHTTTNTGGLVIILQDSTLAGVPGSAKTHGIKTDTMAARVIVQNSVLEYFNDDIDIQSAPTTIITGNFSIGTHGAASVLISGSNPVIIANNQLDKPPVAVIASGFGTSPSITGGYEVGAFSVNVGTGGTASFGVITLPFAANNGWGGSAVNNTNSAVSVTVVTTNNTTQITLTNYGRVSGIATAWAASDVIKVICTPS